MKGKKIVATLIALAMVFSVVVVLNQVDIKIVGNASATMGIDEWNSNKTGKVIINESDGEPGTAAIYVGQTVLVHFNGTLITGSCNLYKPNYYKNWSAGQNVYTVNYTKDSSVGTITDIADPKKTISFDRAGLWLVVADDAPYLKYVNMSNMSYFDELPSAAWEDIVGWFWVNSSEWTVKLNGKVAEDTYYDKNETLEIQVYDGNDPINGIAGWIDIWLVQDDDYDLIFHHQMAATHNGLWELDGDVLYEYTHDYGAGLYRISAYADTNPLHSKSMYEAEGDGPGADPALGWNTSFGNTTIWPKFDQTIRSSVGSGTVIAGNGYNNTTYRWDTCGPFDPPEYWGDYANLTVNTGVPMLTVTSSDIYYGDALGNINITVNKYDDEVLNTEDANMTVADGKLFVRIYNNTWRPGRSPTGPLDPDYFVITNGSEDGWFTISMNTTGGGNAWGMNESQAKIWSAANKKLYIYANYSTVGNATDEWNASTTVTLKGPEPQIRWIDDDGAVDWGAWTDDDDGVIPAIPAVGNVPLAVQFQVLGDEYQFWGDANNPGGVSSEENAMENITISGDALFTGTLDTLSQVVYAAGTWTVPIIPLMGTNGGEITITANAFNTTLEKTITIGGSKYWQNGSIVTVTPNEFMIDVANQTLTIAVLQADGVSKITTATVSLYYISDGSVGNPGDVISGAGKAIDSVTSDINGDYTMIFNLTQQTDNQTAQAGLNDIKAPRNLTVYANVGAGYYGYALVQMLPQNDLEVEISETTILAGQVYDDFTITCTMAGNSTETPSEDDEAQFFVEVYDEEGNDVTDTLLSAGGYTSAELVGNSAIAVDYVFTLDDFYVLEAGKYTFYCYNYTHTSEGQNATLVVEQVEVTCDKNPFIWSYDDNISATFTILYGNQLMNGSLVIDNMTNVGDYNMTWANCSFDGSVDTGGNASLEIEDIVGGVTTVSDITAEYLLPGEAEQYISFWFSPGDDGVYALASTQMLVSVPTVTPDKMYIPVGRTSTVNCDVTGRLEYLEDVYVRLHGQGVDTNGTSDAQGRITFSILPNTNGNISIDVGEEGRTIDTVIIVTNWILDVTAPSEVDEGDTFTVTVMREGTTTEITDAQVKFNTITDSEAPYTFTAPEVTSDRQFTITATAEGYAPDPDTITITVINVPKLVISVDAEVTTGATFEIAVAKDTGDPCIGATVTFNGKTYKSKAGGVVTLTAPSTAGAYDITASFGTFKDATETVTVVAGGGIPGFEVLTLIAAIGVAFILLRRRKH